MADNEDFLALARKRFTAASEDEKDLRAKFVEDLKFASPDGEDQWDANLKAQRQQQGRPAMAFPRCHIYVNQVANEARQNKPQIKFAPRLDADKDTAEVYEGLARYIQYTSEAQIAYETAVEYSAGASFGYYRFITDYCDDDSEDQELKIIPVLDPLTVYGVLVPACFGRKPLYAFVIQDIPKEEYKLLYPKSELASLPWGEAERRNEGWIGSESIRIAEYWYCETKKVEGKRKPQTIVKSCKINGYEILPGDDGESSETQWLGSSIPIIPVLGKQMIQEGKPKLFSVVRPQKTAQQLINYSKSRIAETLSIAPVSPFMIANGQITGFEQQWASLNTQLTPYLTYNQVDVMGKPAPPPQRQTFEPPIQSLSAFVMQEIDDMKATTGIFDASLGNQGNETTGKAIMARQQQSNLSVMHFMDNLERSFRQAGDVLCELIPKIYDTAREIRILGPDEASKVVQINQEHMDESGKQRNYDMTIGKYDVVVTMGRAFSTKRMESFDMIQQLVQSAPNMLPMFGDVMFRNSDIAGADIIADRFHALLPPAVQDKDNNIPPEARAAVAQAQQQVQQMQGELSKLAMERDAKVLETQGKLQQIQVQHQADMQLEDKRLAVQVAVAEVTTKAQNEQERQLFIQDIAKEVLKQHGANLQQAHKQAHEHASDAHQNMHERQMQADKATQTAELADQQAANQSAQSAQDASQVQPQV